MNAQDTLESNKAKKIYEQIKEHFKIGGWVDAQYSFDQNSDGSKSSVMMIRRARLDFKGNLSKWVDFRLQADFAPSPRLIDGYVKVNFCKFIQLQVGQFKIPFSLENKLSPLDLELTENAQVISALSGYKDVTGISSYANGREIGLMLTGTLASAEVQGEKIPILQYGVGVFGGNGINVKTDNMAKDFSARIEFFPFTKHLTISASGYWGKYNMVFNDASTKTDGARIRYAGGAQYADEHWMVRSEYLWGRTDFAYLDEQSDTYTPTPTYTQGFYVVVGYWFDFGWSKNVIIRQKLRPVVRIDYYQKNLDPLEKHLSIYYSAGLDWWPEKHVRVQLDYTLKQFYHTGEWGHNITAMTTVKF